MFKNKRGADSTMGPMIWLIVILLVAALVIFFVAGGFEKIGNLFGQAPTTLEGAVQICNTIQTPTTFCEQARFVETPSGNQYVNCKYSLIDKELDLAKEVDCKVPVKEGERIPSDLTSERAWGIYMCKNLLIKGDWKSGIKANDVLCEGVSCDELGGDTVINADCPDGKTAYKKGFKETGSDTVCCLS